jgi:hypothetical protein
MKVTHGFRATMTALPRRGDEPVEFLLNAAAGAGRGGAKECVLFLVGRSEGPRHRLRHQLRGTGRPLKPRLPGRLQCSVTTLRTSSTEPKTSAQN